MQRQWKQFRRGVGGHKLGGKASRRNRRANTRSTCDILDLLEELLEGNFEPNQLLMISGHNILNDLVDLLAQASKFPMNVQYCKRLVHVLEEAVLGPVE